MAEKRYALGLGCREGAPAAEMMRLVDDVLSQAGLSEATIQAVATLAGKEQQPAVLAVCARFGLEAMSFAAARLEEETPRLANPSKTVFREIGCHGVAEAAALAALGSGARLLVPKRTHGGVTAALAEG